MDLVSAAELLPLGGRHRRQVVIAVLLPLPLVVLVLAVARAPAEELLAPLHLVLPHERVMSLWVAERLGGSNDRWPTLGFMIHTLGHTVLPRGGVLLQELDTKFPLKSPGPGPSLSFCKLVRSVTGRRTLARDFLDMLSKLFNNSKELLFGVGVLDGSHGVAGGGEALGGSGSLDVGRVGHGGGVVAGIHFWRKMLTVSLQEQE